MRITAGKYKAKSIKTVVSREVRPTSSKIRESIFNMLQDQVSDSLMLDLFAGSGIMGLEALSRGAKKVIFVENNHQVFSLLKANMLGFEADYDLIFSDAIKTLDNLSGHKFDIIFVDPPYASGLIPAVLEKIKTNSLLSDDGIVILEHSSKRRAQEVVETDDFIIVKAKSYGDTAVTFLKTPLIK